MKKWMPVFLLAGIICGLFARPVVCRAEIAGPEGFQNPAWEMVYEEARQKPDGVVQSICTTENYIITIENTSDTSNEADVVSAYYKNPTDEYGNPVEQYSLAKRVEEMDWEHGNGMAYNPSTNEIYVSLYTNKTPETRGCLYVMDPETLTFKRSIKISDSYNILGIGYKEDTNQYVMQTNIEGGYGYKLLDSNFQIVEEMTGMQDENNWANYQDLYVSGDYILNYPLTLFTGKGDFINLYSISGKNHLASYQQNFNFQDVKLDEPEGLCELEPGTFITVVNVEMNDGSRRVRFYTSEIPSYVTVTASAENGVLGETSKKVLKGSEVTLDVKAKDGYELSKVRVDGQEQTAEEQKGEKGEITYQLPNIRSDSQLNFIFTKIPIKINYKPFIMGALAAVAMGFFSISLTLIHIRRERSRKRARARIARQRIIWEKAGREALW